MTKPAEFDQQGQDKDWRKIAEAICQESSPERIISLSQELVELLDRNRERSRARVVEMTMRETQ